MKKSKLSSVIEFAVGVVLLNLLFLVGCLPVLTAGTAFTSMYAGLRALIKKEPYLRAYFKAFRTGFVRSTVVWIILLVIDVVPLWHTRNIYVEALETGALAEALPMLLFSAVFALLLLAITTMVFLLYSRFECTVGQLLRFGTSLTLSHPLRAAAIALLTWLPLFVIMLDAIYGTYYTLLLATVWLFFYAATVAIGAIWLMNRPFALFAAEALGMDTTKQDN